MKLSIQNVKRRLFTSSENETRTDGGTTVPADAETSPGSDSDTDPQGTQSSGGFGSSFDSEFVQSLPFWLPPFLLMGFFVYGAIGWNLLISLTDLSGYALPDYSTLDFEQYTRAFSSPEFLSAAQNTVALLVAFTLTSVAVGLALAILIDRQIRFEDGFRTIYLLPFSLSFVVTAQLWLWMYDYNNGIVNMFFRSVGISPPDWIGNPQFVLGAVIFALVWQFSGYAMVVFLAGLQTIPDEHFEAARIDGASTIRMYWRVIIPQLRGSMISALVVLMIVALKTFDFLYALFGQYQPKKGSDILATLMVREAFSNNNLAYGSAISILLFVMALGVIGPYLYSQYRRGEL